MLFRKAMARPCKIPKKNRAKIARDIARGVPQREIATKHGVTQGAISHLARKDEIKALVERARERLITRTLNPAVDNLHQVVTSDTDDLDRYKLKLKYSAEVARAAGVLPSYGLNKRVQQADEDRGSTSAHTISEFGRFLQARLSRVVEESAPDGSTRKITETIITDNRQSEPDLIGNAADSDESDNIIDVSPDEVTS